MPFFNIKFINTNIRRKRKLILNKNAFNCIWIISHSKIKNTILIQVILPEFAVPVIVALNISFQEAVIMNNQTNNISENFFPNLRRITLKKIYSNFQFNRIPFSHKPVGHTLFKSQIYILKTEVYTHIVFSSCKTWCKIADKKNRYIQSQYLILALSIFEEKKIWLAASYRDEIEFPQTSSPLLITLKTFSKCKS